jgi:transcriptional regulator with XRE-family HTH domain
MSFEKKVAEYVSKNKEQGEVNLMEVAAVVAEGKNTSMNGLQVIQELLELGIVASIVGDGSQPVIKIVRLTGKKEEELMEDDSEVEEPIPADNLKDLIKGSQYSQKELAKRLGVSKSTIYRATKNPEKYVDVVNSVCDLLGVANFMEKEEECCEDPEPKVEVSEEVKEYNLEEIQGVLDENKKLRGIVIRIAKAVTKSFVDTQNEINELLQELE